MYALKLLCCQGGRVVTRLHIALGERLHYFSILCNQTKKGGGANICNMVPYSTRLKKVGLQNYISDQGRRWGCNIHHIKEGGGAALHSTILGKAKETTAPFGAGTGT